MVLHKRNVTALRQARENPRHRDPEFFERKLIHHRDKRQIRRRGILRQIAPPGLDVLTQIFIASPIEDERCIAFVCITRAKDLVYLSSIKQYRKSTFFPSRFIKEMEL